MGVGGNLISRRRMLAYLVAAPTLTMVVKCDETSSRPPPAGAAPRRRRRRRPQRRAHARRPADGLPAQDRDHRRRTASWSHVPARRGRPGDHHRDGHHRGRGARRAARRGRRRARRRPSRAALEPAHRRIELGARALHADAHRRGRGPGPARHGRRAAVRRRRPRRSPRATRRSSRPTAAPRRSGRCRPRPRRSPCPAVPGDAEGPRVAFTLIGQPTTRLDARDIVTGAAEVRARPRRAGRAPTVVARPPTIGGTCPIGRRLGRPGDARRRSVSPASRAASPSRPTTFDQAEAARDALRITWNPGPNAGLSDAQIRTQLQAAAAAVRRASARRAGDRPHASTSRSPRTHRSRCYLRRRRPRRSGGDLVRREEPDRRRPEGRRSGRPPGRARSRCTSSGPAARSATGCSSSPRSRPRRCRRRWAGRSS